MKKEELKKSEQKNFLPKRTSKLSHPFILALLKNITDLRPSSQPIEQSIRHPLTADKLKDYITNGHFWQVAAVVKECEVDDDAALSFLAASFEYYLAYLRRQQEKHVHTFGKISPYTHGQIENLGNVVTQLKLEEEKIKAGKILSK